MVATASAARLSAPKNCNYDMAFRYAAFPLVPSLHPMGRERQGEGNGALYRPNVLILDDRRLALFLCDLLRLTNCFFQTRFCLLHFTSNQPLDGFAA